MKKKKITVNFYVVFNLLRFNGKVNHKHLLKENIFVLKFAHKFFGLVSVKIYRCVVGNTHEGQVIYLTNIYYIYTNYIPQYRYGVYFPTVSNTYAIKINCFYLPIYRVFVITGNIIYIGLSSSLKPISIQFIPRDIENIQSHIFDFE